MKILIMDDSQDKRSQICEVLTGMCGLSSEEIDQAEDINKGRKLLFDHQYDLLILDLLLPVNHGDEIIPDRGARFIEEFDRYARLNKPLVIIGLTAYEEPYDQMKKQYDDKLWDLILYRQNSTDWMDILQRAVQKVFDLRAAILKSVQGADKFDVGIICARSEEFVQMERAFDNQWQTFEVSPVSGLTFKWMEKLNRQAEKVRFVTCCCGQDGMTATTTVSTYLYTYFGVREIYMTGFCAGFPGRVENGDVLVAVSEYDYLHARIDEEAEVAALRYAPYIIPCSNSLRLQVETFVHDNSFPYAVHVSGGACGPYLVTSEPMLMESLLKRDSSLRGLDTEGYGLYAAQYLLGGNRSCLLIKGITDLSNQDNFQRNRDESAYKSALFLREFLMYKYGVTDIPLKNLHSSQIID